MILIYRRDTKDDLTPEGKQGYADRARLGMNKRLFGKLASSMEQHNEIARGHRASSREFHVDAVAVKAIRAITPLSQPKFARLLNVDVDTLRNWEQGRCEPAGPAKAPRVIKRIRKTF